MMLFLIFFISLPLAVPFHPFFTPLSTFRRTRPPIQLAAIGSGTAYFSPLNYTYSEEMTTMTIRIPLAKTVSAREIKFETTTNQMTLKIGDLVVDKAELNGRVDTYGCLWSIESNDDDNGDGRELVLLLTKEPLKKGFSSVGDDDWFGVFVNETTFSRRYRSLDGSEDEDLDVEEYVDEMVKDVRGGFDLSKVDRSVYDSVKEDVGFGGDGDMLNSVLEGLRERVVSDDTDIDELEDDDDDGDDAAKEVKELRLADFEFDEDGKTLEDGTVDLRTIAVDQVGPDFKMD